jgi:magnesium transporter
MPRLIKKVSKKAGLSPGTLIHVGERKADKSRIRLIEYGESKLEEREVQTAEECFPSKENLTVIWINVDGLHQVEILEQLGNRFGFHPLVLEDILNTEQRPKMEDFEKYVFLVLKMIHFNDRTGQIEAEQISLILGPHYVVSFQEKEGDLFDPVRIRIRSGKGRIRKMGTDYLAYALMDAIVDNYFIALEKIGERIEQTEQQLVSNPVPETLQTIHHLKREMIFLRKSVWPLREVIGVLDRGESPLFRDATRVFLRDLYDHTIQVIDTIETFRDMLSGMLDIYLSSLSNRMNAVMKVLTIIATIFIPLTFVAGIYGMNFRYMPELEWHWAYPLLLVVMLLIAAAMLFYFRRKQWL